MSWQTVSPSPNASTTPNGGRQLSPDMACEELKWQSDDQAARLADVQRKTLENRWSNALEDMAKNGSKLTEAISTILRSLYQSQQEFVAQAQPYNRRRPVQAAKISLRWGDMGGHLKGTSPPILLTERSWFQNCALMRTRRTNYFPRRRRGDAMIWLAQDPDELRLARHCAGSGLTACLRALVTNLTASPTDCAARWQSCSANAKAMAILHFRGTNWTRI